jgi:hypothetical protein
MTQEKDYSDRGNRDWAWLKTIEDQYATYVGEWVEFKKKDFDPLLTAIKEMKAALEFYTDCTQPHKIGIRSFTELDGESWQTIAGETMDDGGSRARETLARVARGNLSE